jgi:hypothetical protein
MLRHELFPGALLYHHQYINSVLSPTYLLDPIKRIDSWTKTSIRAELRSFSFAANCG